ncbi:exo-beta-1,3-glucanase [Clavulina sp. PMI_390]|nr:exo-beta-1,3-glucanase [Clavulina sp. PMI_390]
MRSFITFWSTSLLFSSSLVYALGTACNAALSPSAAPSDPFWLESIKHQGTSPYNANSTYSVFRNVKSYGAKGDGVTDDTTAINNAIADGLRCGYPTNCSSSTLTPALVYFPTGTYLVSSSLIAYYYTSMVGDAKRLPVLKAAANFSGAAVIDADVYIPGGGGAEWYTNQNNFFRAVRNMRIDLTAMADTAAAVGIHWQVAQATSLVNVIVDMSTAANNTHIGVSMENGSGGVMTDLVFNGGQYGISVGNQQFTVRNITVNNANTAIKAIWNWGWTFQDVTISNCQVGFVITTGGTATVNQTVGSESIVDAVVTNTPVFLMTTTVQTASLSGSILLENIQLSNVPRAVVDESDTTVLAGGSLTIPQWLQGNVAGGSSPTVSYQQASLSPPKKPSSLTTSSGVFGRARPQYQDYAASQFQSVKSAGARGDGVADDTAALQAVIDAHWGCKIIFFDAGIYLVTDTLKIPAGTRIVGELWSIIQASGLRFTDQAHPRVMVQVGKPGDTAATEISDIVFTSKGGSAGAILVEWNVGASSQGSAGMWDSHVRIGGFTGSDIQVSNCGNTTLSPFSECAGAYMSLHLTPGSSAYLENVWLWTADHDLDDPAQGNINSYSGRGMLIDTSEPVWLLGTASEHHALYQYNAVGAKALYIALIQTETPYYQPSPEPPSPFMPNPHISDPTYGLGDSAWALYIQKSSDVHAYGTNMYSFFRDYDETCLNTATCQSKILNVDTVSSNIFIYNIATVGVTYSVSVGGSGTVNQDLSPDGMQSTLGLWKSGSSTSGNSSTTTTSKGSTTTFSSNLSSTPCITVPTSLIKTIFTTSTAAATTTTSKLWGCSGVAAWLSTTSYNTGASVTFDGYLWTALSWTLNDAPGGLASGWTKGGAC